MNLQLIEYLKEFLSKNDIDGLVINSTNEFLVEYNLLEKNSRYHLTDFSGSTGDVLFTSNKIYLFVDSRYHEQADIEVNKELITVVKIPLNKTYVTALSEEIPAYAKIGVIAQKTSKKLFDKLVDNTQQKNTTIKLLNIDPVEEYKKEEIKDINYNVFSVPLEIAGISADEKFNQLKEFAGEKFNILVTSLEDIAYITNLRSYDFQYSSVFPSKAIIKETGVNLYTDCVVPYIGQTYTVKPLCEFEKDLKSISKEDLFIDETHLTIQDYNLIDKSNKIYPSRLNLLKTVKNESEINHLKTCFERSDEALKVILEMINSDNIFSEYDYYQALVKALKDNGAKALSFKPIVASGSNSSIVHYSTPSKEKLVQEGDFLLVDFGGYYEGGYATDTTRTFLKGTPTQEQKTAYTAVIKAFFNAYYNQYNKKSSYFNIDKIARDTIEKNISEDYKFAHATGHGVGISVHENPPRVSANDASKTKIIENSVFSIEPGVYKEGWGGIRLENTVYAKQEEDKITLNSFSHFQFEIKLVDFSMLNDYEKYYYIKWQKVSCNQ